MYPHVTEENPESVTVGGLAPDFVLETESGGRWSLREHRGKVSVLLFYPANETLVCTKQLCSVRDNWERYLATKAEIIGITPTPAEDNELFKLRHGFPISILADRGREVTSVYARHWLYPISFMRSIAVIDADGIVRTHQTMLRAFRPNDEDVIAAIYGARADALQAKTKEMRTRIRQIFIG